MSRFEHWVVFGCLLAPLVGCATIKQSDTARTGIEQMLISSAVDRSLEKIDFAPVRGAKVFLDDKYLDCVDKNYVLLAMRQKLLAHGCTLPDKADDADVVMQVASGAVGTDRQDLFAGISQIPLPPPSPISIPKFELFGRDKANGTAKLLVVAIDKKTQLAVINNGASLARSDYKVWSFIGGGPIQTGSVPRELAAIGNSDGLTVSQTQVAGRSGNATR
jgi:hypothetical protein